MADTLATSRTRAYVGVHVPEHHRTARAGTAGHRRRDRGGRTAVHPQGQRHHTAPQTPTTRPSKPRSPRSLRPPTPLLGVLPAAPPAPEDRAAVAPARGAGPHRGAWDMKPRCDEAAEGRGGEEQRNTTPRCDEAARGRGGEGGERSTPALKEWGAVVHALLDGRQTVLLRKGGHPREAVRGHRPPIPVVPDGRAQPRRTRAARAPRPARPRGSRQHRRTTSWCGRPPASWRRWRSTRPERLDDIEDLHIWTSDSVRADRLDFRPKHRLTVLVVAAQPLVQPVQLPRLAGYAGCKSWVDLPLTAQNSCTRS